jgi:hypothetical protein
MQAALTRRSSRDLHAGVDAAGAPSRRARHLPNAVIHHFNCTIAMNVVLLDAASVALDNITSIAAHRRRRRSMRRTGGLHRGIGAAHAPHAWPVLCRSRVAHAGRLAWAAANQVIFKAMESKNLLSQTNMLLSKEVELADMPFQLMRTASITLTSSPLPLPSASSSIVS